MYGFTDYHNISPNEILSLIDQKAAFFSIFKIPIIEGNKYISPFRIDKRAGCFFISRDDGTLLFVDFNDPLHTHRTAITAISDFHHLTTEYAIQYLYDNFKLNSPIIRSQANYKPQEEKQRFDITYKKRDYNNKDTKQWSQFFIKISQLQEDNVFAISEYTTLNYKGAFRFTPFDLTYAIDFIDAVKLYRPNHFGKYRWITNCNENHIGNFKNLPKTAKSFNILSSYKDCRIIRNLGYDNSIWFQNETCTPDRFIIDNLLSKCKYLNIIYDNDRGGLEGAHKLARYIGLSRTKITILPKFRQHKELFGKYMKDLGEIINKEGSNELLTILKKLRI